MTHQEYDVYRSDDWIYGKSMLLEERQEGKAEHLRENSSQ